MIWASLLHFTIPKAKVLFENCAPVTLKTLPVSELTWAKVELVGEPSSPFSLSTLVGWLEGLDMGLEENTSFRVLLTDGRVL